jgi:hypothetical protein
MMAHTNHNSVIVHTYHNNDKMHTNHNVLSEYVH